MHLTFNELTSHGALIVFAASIAGAFVGLLIKAFARRDLDLDDYFAVCGWGAVISGWILL